MDAQVGQLHTRPALRLERQQNGQNTCDDEQSARHIDGRRRVQISIDRHDGCHDAKDPVGSCRQCVSCSTMDCRERLRRLCVKHGVHNVTDSELHTGRASHLQKLKAQFQPSSAFELVAVVEAKRNAPVAIVDTASVPLRPKRGSSTHAAPINAPGIPMQAMISELR